MKLQTNVPLGQAEHQIDYESRLLLLGSCFSEHIGEKLEYFKFRTLQNPFGILFQPKAIENLIERTVRNKVYDESDIFFLNERWQSFDAHSDLSDTSDKKLLENLNNSLASTLVQLKKASHVVITLGTAWVYRSLVSRKIVANCHKVPQKSFSKELLSVTAIEESLRAILELVRSINKEVHFVFTVSPVRHLKDGFVENQRSKSHLISAVHEVLNTDYRKASISYFPSYELQMDELRDYRFYKQDMIHPNRIAIDYIWEKFRQVWFSESTVHTMNDVQTIQKGLLHRPFHPDSLQHKAFKKVLETKIINLQSRYSFIRFENRGLKK